MQHRSSNSPTSAATPSVDELRRSLEDLEAIFDASPLAIFRTEPKGTVTMWSPAAQRLFGWTAEEVIGRRLPIVPADRWQEFEQLRDRLLAGEPIQNFEALRLRKDGMTLDVSVSVGIVHGADGRVVGMLGMVADITLRKQAEAKLRESEEKWRLLVEHSPDFIFTLDHRYEITYINRVAPERRPEDVLGRNIFDLANPDTHAEMRRCLDGALHRGESSSFEGSSRDPERHYFSRVAPIRRDGKVVAAMIVATDITEMKQTEQKLAESERHYREAAESNRRLLHEVNHRVRNNLASLSELVNKAQDRATDAASFADAMRRRIQAMSQVDKLMAGERWSHVSLATLISSLRDATQSLSHHEVPVTMQGEEVLVCAAQAPALAMTFSELFTNSVKHGAHSMPTGRLAIAWTRVARKPGAGERIRLTWTETGGPVVTGPIKESLGTELIKDFVKFELGGTCALRFPQSGAAHEFEFRIDPVTPSSAT